MVPSPKIMKALEATLGELPQGVRLYDSDNSLTASQIATNVGKMPECPIRLGVAWILQDDFETLQRLCLPDTHWRSYSDWLKIAELKIREFMQKMPQAELIRVVIRPIPFKAWCDQHGVLPDHESQAAFVVTQINGGRSIEVFVPGDKHE